MTTATWRVSKILTAMATDESLTEEQRCEARSALRLLRDTAWLGASFLAVLDVCGGHIRRALGLSFSACSDRYARTLHDALVEYATSRRIERDGPPSDEQLP